RLGDALFQHAFAALNASPGARRYYDTMRARGIGHNDALHRVAHRLVGILHGCLRTPTTYDEATAWTTPQQDQQEAA
ncbi:MAG: IS110 family transposase, partial [Pseudonocardiaceae bacterium]